MSSVEMELAEVVGESEELVSRALWALVECGGSETKAQSLLEQEGVKRQDGEPIKRSTLGNWKRQTFKHRYTDLRTRKMNAVDEILVTGAQALAIKMGEAEESALKQTMAGIADLNALEASNVLRNVSASKQIQLKGALELRGQEVEREGNQAMERVLKELKGLKVVHVREEAHGIIDAEVVDESGAGSAVGGDTEDDRAALPVADGDADVSVGEAEGVEDGEVVGLAAEAVE